MRLSNCFLYFEIQLTFNAHFIASTFFVRYQPWPAFFPPLSDPHPVQPLAWWVLMLRLSDLHTSDTHASVGLN